MILPHVLTLVRLILLKMAPQCLGWGPGPPISYLKVGVNCFSDSNMSLAHLAIGGFSHDSMGSMELPFQRDIQVGIAALIHESAPCCTNVSERVFHARIRQRCSSESQKNETSFPTV